MIEYYLEKNSSENFIWNTIIKSGARTPVNVFYKKLYDIIYVHVRRTRRVHEQGTTLHTTGAYCHGADIHRKLQAPYYFFKTLFFFIHARRNSWHSCYAGNDGRNDRGEIWDASDSVNLTRPAKCLHEPQCSTRCGFKNCLRGWPGG